MIWDALLKLSDFTTIFASFLIDLILDTIQCKCLSQKVVDAESFGGIYTVKKCFNTLSTILNVQNMFSERDLIILADGLPVIATHPPFLLLIV